MSLFTSQPEQPQEFIVHNWILVAKTYASPTQVREGLSPETVEKAMFGVTSFLFQCENTGDILVKEIIGNDEDRTEDLCEKVKRFGPQTITYGTDTYAIAKIET